MEIKISFKHMDSNDELKEFTEHKSLKLKKYFDGKIQMSWNFAVEHLDRVAHCHLTGNHMDYFGEGRSLKDMRDAIDDAIEALEKQVRKKKEVLKNHKSV